MKKFNIGCGRNYMEEYINIDNCRRIKADIYFNLNKKWKIKNNSADLILMDNVLEHLKEPVFQLSEIHRVLKRGGKAIIRVPHYSCFNAYGLLHIRQFNTRFFDLEKRSKWNYEYGFYFNKVVVRNKFLRSGKSNILMNGLSGFIEFFMNINTGLYEILFSNLFPIYEIEVELLK